MDPIFAATSKVLLGVIGLVILVVALKIMAGAKKAQYSDTARTGANVVVGMVFVAIGLGAVGYAAFGTQILASFGVTAPAPAPADKPK